MALPSGRLIRGRGLRIDNPYKPDPEFAYVRQNYSPDAVETLEQASFVADFR